MDRIVDRFGSRRDGSRAERILKDESKKRAEDADTFSLVTILFPRFNWASIIVGLRLVRRTSGKKRKISERERKGSPASMGYAGELKSLHAPTVMYGDCACVTRLALRSVIRPSSCSRHRGSADNYPLLSRYRSRHRYLFYTRVHAAVVKVNNC